MAECTVEPGDFEHCLACYAYKITQDRETQRAGARPVPAELLARRYKEALETIVAGDSEPWDMTTGEMGLIARTALNHPS
jgi:hypothetical protein